MLTFLGYLNLYLRYPKCATNMCYYFWGKKLCSETKNGFEGQNQSGLCDWGQTKMKASGSTL